MRPSAVDGSITLLPMWFIMWLINNASRMKNVYRSRSPPFEKTGALLWRCGAFPATQLSASHQCERKMGTGKQSDAAVPHRLEWAALDAHGAERDRSCSSTCVRSGVWQMGPSLGRRLVKRLPVRGLLKRFCAFARLCQPCPGDNIDFRCVRQMNEMLSFGR